MSILKPAIAFLFLIMSSLAIGQDNAEKQLTAEKLFAPDHVVNVEIELDESDWDAVRTQSRSFAEGLSKDRPEKPFTYVKGNVTVDGLLIKDVGIRKKGFLGSLNKERPSLKIKFEEYTKQTPIKGLSRLTLNNNNQDAGRISQFLSYKLFRESGTHAPRCGFAKVTVNGKYLGIYTNVEAIKSEFLKHSFGSSKGALYEGTVTDFFPEFNEKFEKKNSPAKTSYIESVSKTFAKKELDLDKVKQLIDVDSFVKFWAMESLIGFWDGYCSNQNNYYLYRDADSKKFHFIPWGTDSAFSDSSPIPPYMIRPRSVHAKAIIPNKLYRIDEVKSQYESTIMEMLEKNWDETALIGEIDRLEEMLTEHVSESNSGFERSLKAYRLFIKGRRKSITSEFKTGPPELLAAEKKPIYFSQIGKIEATFSTQWLKREPSDMSKYSDLSLKLTVNDKEVVLKNAGVFAKKDDRDPNNASIMIMGDSVKSGKKIIIVAVVPKTSFVPSKDSVGTGGVLIQPGMLGMIGAKMKMAFGTLQLDEASVETGEPVSGKLMMTIGDFKSPDAEEK